MKAALRWAGWILVTVLVISWSLSALAAGEWVLWIKHLPRGSHGYWDIWSTYPSRTACQDARRKVIFNRLVRDMLKREEFKTEEELQRETERTVAKDVRHQCLPDAIDPREKKQ